MSTLLTPADFDTLTDPTRAAANATIERDIINIHIDQCRDGRFQKRQPNDPDLPALADSLWRDGQQQPAVGIALPDGSVELILGHRRRDARRLNHARYLAENPGETHSSWEYMDVDIRTDLTPVQIFRISWAENSARRDLDAIEKAEYLRFLCSEVRLSQAQAGAELGLTQSAASHLLALLNLPPEIQAHIRTGDLPERLARQTESLHRLSPPIAAAVAAAVAQAEPSDKEAAARNAYTRALSNPQTARNLSTAGLFDLKATLTLDPALHPAAAALDIPTTVPPCTGCQFLKQENSQSYCLAPQCFNLKAQSVAIGHARPTANEWQVQLNPTPDSSWQLVEDLGVSVHLLEDWVNQLLVNKKARALLRVVPVQTTNEPFPRRYTRTQYSGASVVGLATQDPAALFKLVPPPQPAPAEEEEDAAPTPKADPAAAQRQAEAQRRKAEAEEAARAERRRINGELLHLAVTATHKLISAPLAHLIWGQLVSDGDLTPVEFQDLTPTEQSRYVMATILANEVEARFHEAGGIGTYYIYAENKPFAKHLYHILAELNLHIPAQIAIACGQDQPPPQPKKAKASKAPKAKSPKPAKSTIKPAPKPSKPAKRK